MTDETDTPTAVERRADEESLLEIEDLDVTFETNRGDVEAVNGVDLTVREGEILGIVGESGSGKSVTCETIVDLVSTPPASIDGDIYYKGRNLRDLSKTEIRQIRGNEIGMIFQDPMSSLNPVHTVGQQIREALDAHGNYEGTAAERAVELMDAVGIPDPGDRLSDYPFEFSGGMRQRVMIAIALANQPDLLVADEPTTALDVTIEAQVLEMIQDLREEFGMSVILITHDFGTVAEVANRVAVMYGGTVVEEGNVFEIFDDPKHPYTRGLLNSIPGRRSDESTQLEAIEGEPPDMTSLPGGCSFHPRCPDAMSHCSEDVPPAYAIDTDSEDGSTKRMHTARCYLYEDRPIARGDTESELTRDSNADS